MSYREGEATRFFNGKENERIPGKRKEERYDTDDRKLEFLQRYGWLIDIQRLEHIVLNLSPRKSKVTNEDVNFAVSNVNYQDLTKHILNEKERTV